MEFNLFHVLMFVLFLYGTRPNFSHQFFLSFSDSNSVNNEFLNVSIPHMSTMKTKDHAGGLLEPIFPGKNDGSFKERILSAVLY